jgi:hypothetical protein
MLLMNTLYTFTFCLLSGRAQQSGGFVAGSLDAAGSLFALVPRPAVYLSGFTLQSSSPVKDTDYQIGKHCKRSQRQHSSREPMRTKAHHRRNTKRFHTYIAAAFLLFIWLALQWLHIHRHLQHIDPLEDTTKRTSSANNGHLYHPTQQQQQQQNNPLTGINQCNGIKYIYYAAFNGFSNQLRAMWFAARIAHSTNRTLITPPLLPHKYEKTISTFVGFDFFNDSPDSVPFMKAVNKSLNDVDKACAVTNRDKTNPNRFPSWSHVLDFDAISRRIGVEMIDLWDFVHTQKRSEECINEFYRQPMTPVSIIALTNRSESWEEFIELFNDQYDNHSIASIGDAYVLNHQGSSHFTSHCKLFKRYDLEAEKRIYSGILSMLLTEQVEGLLKVAMSYLPDNYASLHLRAGDRPGEEIQTCADEALVGEYSKVLETFDKSNIAEGSTIYIASNSGMAKECFDVISKKKYKLMTLTDIKEIDSKSPTPKIKDVMDGISVDPATKNMLIDLFLVAMGVEVAFAMVHFEETRFHYSTAQATMQTIHDVRKLKKPIRPIC